jgi:hypothetical protein
VSEASEQPQPRRFQVAAPYIQVRVPNINGTRSGFRVSAWLSMGAKQGKVLSEDEVHPDDLAHLLQARLTPALGGGPLIEQLPEAVKETSR